VSTRIIIGKGLKEFFLSPFDMEQILIWKDALDELDRIRRVAQAAPLPVILFANESDITRYASVPPLEQLRAFAASHGFNREVQASAKDAMHRLCPSSHQLLKISCTAARIRVSVHRINEAVSIVVNFRLQHRK
jgi:hypothetical protein